MTQFPPGTPWRTRGGWKAIVVENPIEGITGSFMNVWHALPNANRRMTHIHLPDGRMDGNDNSYDLVEPWRELRGLTVDLEIRFDDRGNWFVMNFKPGSFTHAKDFEERERHNFAAIRVQRTLTEGEGL